MEGAKKDPGSHERKGKEREQKGKIIEILPNHEVIQTSRPEEALEHQAKGKGKKPQNREK